MRTLAIGFDFEGDSDTVDFGSFRSSESFLDYELVIWDPEGTLSEYSTASGGNSTYNGLRVINSQDSLAVVEDIKRRHSEMKDMLRLGRSIAILTRQPQHCYIYTGERQWSGTGKNARGTNFVREVDVLSAVPLEDLQTVKASGKNLEFRGDGPFTAFWHEMKEYLSYDAYVEDNQSLHPFVFIRGTDRIVGCHIPTDNGNLLLIPGPEEGLADEEKSYEELEEITNLFLQSVSALVEQLNVESSEDLPSWSEDYSLPEEEKLKDKISENRAQLDELDTLLKEQEERVAELQKYKLLYTGSGTSLEHVVRRVFEELGVSVEEAEPNRDDLIVNYEGSTAVVEVKGVKGSAAEKHAAQLEKWVSEYQIKNDTSPKGILVVNTFRKTPLEDRSSTSFPDQMLPYCESREHCLITGAQLFCLYLEFLNGRKSAQEAIEELLRTIGIYESYEIPSQYIMENYPHQ